MKNIKKYMLTYKDKERLLRAKEAREAKQTLADEMEVVSKQVNSCNSISELRELKNQASQILQRFNGLKKDLQPFGLWSKDDQEGLQRWAFFWAE